MRPRYAQFNPKRRLKKPEPGDREALALLAEKIGYDGNPEHKKSRRL